MSSLDSSNSIAEVLASYADNASYEEDASVAKAKAFVTACRIMLSWPKRERLGSGGSASEYEIEPDQLRQEIEAAQAYIAANRPDDSPSVLDVDFSEFDPRT